MRHAGLAGRLEKSRHVQMRSNPYVRGGIVFPHIGEQEQH